MTPRKFTTKSAVRELETLFEQGLNNSEIARTMNISERTVRYQLIKRNMKR